MTQLPLSFNIRFHQLKPLQIISTIELEGSRDTLIVIGSCALGCELAGYMSTNFRRVEKKKSLFGSL